MKCKNTRTDHEVDPRMAAKRGGYCLDCVNAGVPEFEDELKAARDTALEEAAIMVLSIRATPEVANNSWFLARTKAAAAIRALKGK